MTHEQCDSLLVELSYGELAPDVAREVEEHLGGCAACAGALADIRRTLSAVRSLPEEPTPTAGIESLLMYAEQQAARMREQRGILPAWLSRSLFRPGWALAGIAVVAGLASYAVVRMSPVPQPGEAQMAVPAEAKPAPAPSVEQPLAKLEESKDAGAPPGALARGSAALPPAEALEKRKLDAVGSAGLLAASAPAKKAAAGPLDLAAAGAGRTRGLAEDEIGGVAARSDADAAEPEMAAAPEAKRAPLADRPPRDSVAGDRELQAAAPSLRALDLGGPPAAQAPAPYEKVLPGPGATARAPVAPAVPAALPEKERARRAEARAEEHARTVVSAAAEVEALFEQAQAELRAERLQNALALFLRVADEHPDSPRAPDALLAAADIEGSRGRSAARDALVRRLLDGYGGSSAARKVRSE